MQEDLDKERKVIMKQWVKREEQIERTMGVTVGIYWGFLGIAGKSLHEIISIGIKCQCDKSISQFINNRLRYIATGYKEQCR
ncbi:hypothetical protein [Nitrosomonas sp.]|uniref:hypothetical protein n=1 Tax=Nitrosomonas sp. TaxID=42353 RepID=UPI0027234BA3|nr:hypothetical protein [Nitrosomonas sp.]MDO8894929.1 hypothetical protein [Nitrosomonas sp.]